LVHGSWSVLVERRVWIDVGNKGRGLGEWGRRMHSGLPDLQAACVRYAFVRVVKEAGIRVGEEGSASGRNGKGQGFQIREGVVEVVGLEGFLGRAVPGTDLGTVRRRVEEFVKEMEAWPGQGRLGEGIEKLAVLREPEAREMLGELLVGINTAGGE
jgi:hypothetical protein